MRALTTLLFGALMVTCLASTATAQRWKYPPGPPYRPTCTDTLKIFDIEQTDSTLAPCHPATLDTVWGIKGIVIGMDQKASAYGFWIQNRYVSPSTNGQWKGIDIFTGGTNYGAIGIAVGDSVAVYGTTQEFNGLTELEGPDTFQNTNDIIIRKITGGNSLPQFKVGTTTEFYWVPSISAATAEPWENCLVRINGPLHVARSQVGAGVGFGNFLVVSNSAPGDSVLVDGISLTTFGAPTVGTNVDFVQGILAQGNSSAASGAVNSYRIQLRDGNDISVSTPPNLNDAYPIEDNVLRVVFDRNLDPTTAQNIANYSLPTFGSSVDAAVLETNPGNVVRLTITTPLVDGDIETLTAQNIGSASCPTCLMASQSRTYVNGVLAITDIQKPDPAFLPLFDDRSRFAGTGSTAGTRLSFRGTCTGAYGTLYYLEDAAGGLRSGVSVFGPSAPLAPGNKYEVVGQVQEFGGETEVVNTVYIVDEGVAGPGQRPQAVPLPQFQLIAVLRDTTTDKLQNMTTGEDYEGVLVRVQDVKCTETRASGLSFFVAGYYPAEPDTILISTISSAPITYTPTLYDKLNVNGVLHFSNNTFRMLPRYESDIEKTGTLGTDPLLTPRALSLSVAPNPARTARVTFALPNRANVDLAVFDLLGRQVKQIAKGSFEAGTYSRAWDGTNASGGRVRAGMYFYRLKADDQVLKTRGVTLN